MSNYQLYRTNILLGGQIKWDLIINNDVKGLTVSEFHLTPISNTALDILPLKSNILKNSHIQNIRTYYNINKNNFYAGYKYINNNHKDIEPIKSSKTGDIDLYSNTYNMGCRRSIYSRNKKQFEFLCPLWIEHITKDIMFNFNVHTSDDKKILLSSKTFKLDMSKLLANDNINNYNKHNLTHTNFLNYLSNYIKSINLHKGNNKVSTISLNVESTNDNYSALRDIKANTTIYGINLNDMTSDGNDSKTISVNYPYELNTLLNTDINIIRHFSDNKFICKQLFNFNLCFNLEDILSINVVKMLEGKANFVNVSMDVYIDGKLLEKRDFDTEYDYIKKTLIYDNTDNEVVKYIQDKELQDENYFNVLKYDNKDGSTNKLYQPICHWSLEENDDYIFNVHPEFEGITLKNINGNFEWNNIYQYKDTPNIYNEVPIIGDCSTRWINTVNITSWTDFYKYIQNTKKYKTDGVHIKASDFEYTMINNVRYDSYKIRNTINDKYLLGIIVNNKLLNFITSSIKCDIVYKDNTNYVYAYQKDDLILLITNNIDYLTFKRFTNAVKSFANKDNALLKNFAILFENGIMLQKLINVIAPDNSILTCVRCDGNIKPKFTDKPSTLYYKNVVNTNVRKGHKGIMKLNNWEYTSVPKVSINNNIADIIDSSGEYSWFNINKCILLRPELQFTKILSYTDFNKETTELENGEFETKFIIKEDKTLTNIVKQKLIDTYNIDKSNTKLISYILSLYTYSGVCNHIGDSATDYEYKITLKLR